MAIKRWLQPLAHSRLAIRAVRLSRPNISGEVRLDRIRWSEGGWVTGSGAFSQKVGQTGSYKAGFGTDFADESGTAVTFEASRVSSLFVDNSSLQVPACLCQIAIRF